MAWCVLSLGCLPAGPEEGWAGPSGLTAPNPSCTELCPHHRVFSWEEGPHPSLVFRVSPLLSRSQRLHSCCPGLTFNSHWIPMGWASPAAGFLNVPRTFRGVATAEKPAPGAETMLREQTQIVSTSFPGNCTVLVGGVHEVEEQWASWGRGSGSPVLAFRTVRKDM